MKRLTSLLIFVAAPMWAQYYPQPQPQQLDALVGRIALYPDPLLAQVLSAATYYDEIADADGWARAHAGLNPDDQARAIDNDGLPWDPSVIALLPFASVLDTMANDMNWTSQLGNAVLADRGAVMDAVQRQRAVAMNYGYLQNNNEYRVVNGGYNDIEILPADPSVVYVPYYDPYVIYSRPRPGFFIGGAITFGPRVAVRSFAPWGWGGSAFRWNEHRIVINSREWSNRPALARPNVAERPQFNDRREYRTPQPQAFRPEQRPAFQQPAFRQPEVHQQPEFRQPQFRQPEVRQQPQFRQQAPAAQPEFRQPEFRQSRGGEDRGHGRGDDRKR